jgi:type IV pilus assembly protein PilY1
MDLFFDTFPSRYSDSSISNGFADGQPILLPPVISVDDNGDMTINVATGDQETLGASTTTSNYVWSLTERTSNDRSLSGIATHVNWYLKLDNGERVVGPMTLFNSQLFFATFAPPGATAHVCSSGTSRVWGMDYIRPFGYLSQSTAINQGGLARLPGSKGDFVQSLTGQDVAGSSDAVIFGVAVAQQPTCSDAATSASNDFLGYGAEQTITHVTPGTYQLVMHIGGVQNNTAAGDLKANVRTVDLKSPPAASHLASWAALVE